MLIRQIARTMSCLKNVKPLPPDPIFSINASYNKDTSKNKVNLGVGAYRTNSGAPYVFSVVRKVENDMMRDESLNKEYLPICGDAEFIACCQEMIFGSDNPTIKARTVTGVQTLSGTGACRLALDFLNTFQECASISVSAPTWPIHHKISKIAGFTSIKEYPYYDNENNSLNIGGMLRSLETLEAGTVVLLQGCGHNPTGMDPSREQWQQISTTIKRQQLIPFFDCAYVGLCSGDIDEDMYAVRKFVEDEHELLVAFSFSKSMGLYNERVGCLNVVTHDNHHDSVLSQLSSLIRTMYSNPPAHGSQIVKRVLSNQENFFEWVATHKAMTKRITQMRSQLCEKLVELGTPGDWSHIVNQKGLFSFTGLNKEQVAQLAEQFHIYMTSNGRINICGLNTKNVDYVARSIHSVVVNSSSVATHSE